MIARTPAKRQDTASTTNFWNSAKKVGFHVHFSAPFSILRLGTCISLSLFATSKGRHLVQGGQCPPTTGFGAGTAPPSVDMRALPERTGLKWPPSCLNLPQ